MDRSIYEVTQDASHKGHLGGKMGRDSYIQHEMVCQYGIPDLMHGLECAPSELHEGDLFIRCAC